MIELLYQKHFRPLQKLSFCYLCGRDFRAGDNINLDHVPPKAAFAKRDRDPLQLPTHYDCNHMHRLNDEKVGQLIAMRRGQVPSVKNRRLRFRTFPDLGITAFTNLDVEGAAFRWVMGFHAALYQEPMPREAHATIFTPFVKAESWGGGSPLLQPTIPEYDRIVATVSMQRERLNADRISCNRGHLLYECVWSQADTGEWLCSFLLDICDWKELGSMPRLGVRDCAGMYVLPTLAAPVSAAVGNSLLSGHDIVHGI